MQLPPGQCGSGADGGRDEPRFSGRRRAHGAAEVTALLQELDVAVVPLGEREWETAVDGFLRFGRGHHEAALNFGDCLALCGRQRRERLAALRRRRFCADRYHARLSNS
jgi:uncharacterized protein with PIN domain